MNKIVFRIEGPEQNHHHLDLSAFVRKTGQFLALLKSIAKDGNADDVGFQVVDLSHSSPVTIECELQGQDALVAFNKIGETLNLIAEKQAGHLSQPVLSAMENIVRYKPQQIAWAEIQTISENEDKCIYKLDDRFKEILSKVRTTEEKVISTKVISTIDGKLPSLSDLRGIAPEATGSKSSEQFVRESRDKWG